MPGLYFEDLSPGQIFHHKQGRTISEADNILFNALTMNTQALHLNEDFAKKTSFGRRIVNGILTLGLVIGITVNELTDGTIIANLGYENIRHPSPVFHGDTIYAETEVLTKRESRSRPEAGIIQFRHIGRNQNGTTVIEIERSILFLRKSANPQG